VARLSFYIENALARATPFAPGFATVAAYPKNHPIAKPAAATHSAGGRSATTILPNGASK